MSVSLYKIAVIESHTFYRKWKKKLWCWFSSDGSWLQVWASEVHTKGWGNSHTFDLLGLSLEFCEVFKAHTGTKDSISLTYNVDWAVLPTLPSGCENRWGQTAHWFVSFGANSCHPLLCPYWVQKLVEVMTSGTALGTKSVNFVSFSQKQCMHPGLCQKLIYQVRIWESKSLHGALGNNWCLLLAQDHKLKAPAW